MNNLDVLQLHNNHTDPNEVLKEELALALAKVILKTRGIGQLSNKIPATAAVLEGPREGIDGVTFDERAMHFRGPTSTNRPFLHLRSSIKKTALAMPEIDVRTRGTHEQSPIEWARITAGAPMQLTERQEELAITMAFDLATERLGQEPSTNLATYHDLFANGNYPLPVCQEYLEAMGPNPIRTFKNINTIMMEEWGAGLVRALTTKLDKRGERKNVITDTKGYRRAILNHLLTSDTGSIKREECYEIAAAVNDNEYDELEDSDQHAIRTTVNAALVILEKTFPWIELIQSNASGQTHIKTIRIKEKPELTEDQLRDTINFAFAEASRRLKGSLPGGKNLPWFRQTYGTTETFPFSTVKADNPIEDPASRALKKKNPESEMLAAS